MTADVLTALVAVGVDIGGFTPLEEGHTGAFLVEPLDSATLQESWAHANCAIRPSR